MIQTIKATERIVPGLGPQDAKIIIVGEAPGLTEARELTPFVGQSGDLLNALLSQARINRAQCYITNVVKKQPLGNKMTCCYYDTRRHQVMTTPEFHTWKEKLFIELKEKKGKNVIIALGNVALYALQTKWGITKQRGSILWNETLDCKVVPCIHPAKALREYLFRHSIIHDLARAKAQSEFHEYVLKERKYLLQPSFGEVKNYLQNILKNEKEIGFDIEVLREEVSHIGLSISPTNAASIDFFRSGRNTFTEDEEIEVLTMIGSLLENPDIKKIGQNLAFDTKFMFEKYNMITNNLDDTMIAHKINLPDFACGLDFICSTYTDVPYYKDEGKVYMKIGGSEKDFSLYNAKDAIICSEAILKMRKELEIQGNTETYKEQVKLIHPLTYMTTRGIKVDVENFQKRKEEFQKEIEDKQEELDSIVGQHLNVKSTTEMRKYFYGIKGIKPYLKQGKPTLDEGALVRIARKKIPEARLCLDIRQKRTLVERYLNILFKYNNRLTCSYNPVGANTGRLSSSKEIITNFGTNNQNIPKSLNDLMLADEGYLIGNVDLAQADNRSVAYIAPEPRMIQAFEEGTDVHALTASIIFNIPRDEIKSMDKEGVKCPIGYSNQTHRYWGKQCNHAFNFGRGYKSFSYDLEIPESEGKELWMSYHRTYPCIRQVFHKWVQGSLGNCTLTNSFGRKFLFLNRWGEELFKQAYAFIPQSNTADIINRWGLNEFYYNDKFKDIELLRQVHDSINFQIPIRLGSYRIAEIITKMKISLERTLQFRDKRWTIPAEFSLGYHLGSKGDGRQIDLDLNPYSKRKFVDEQIESILTRKIYEKTT